MTADVPSTLLEWGRLPGPAKVLAKARRRMEEGHGLNGAPLRLDLTVSERVDIGRLLGTAWALSTRPVGIQSLAAAVAAVGSDLASLLQALDGPVRDRPAERAAVRASADSERRAAAEELIRAGVANSDVQIWLASRGLPRSGTGLLHQLAADTAAVLCNLPGTNDTVLLPVLAATALNDPHGLDRGSRVATAVLRLAASSSDSHQQSEAEAWRSAWESLGVVCDELSSRVLVLNLPLIGSAAACSLTAAAGSEPLWLTWRSLTGTFTANEAEIFICENPAIVAAAANELGPRSRPLICTNGRPSGATRRLIASLASAGTTLRVRADDDLAGQQIVAEVCSIAPAAQLWRYERRSPGPASARYEEQDLDLLLMDLGADGGDRVAS